jgi:hypothetical protein
MYVGGATLNFCIKQVTVLVDDVLRSVIGPNDNCKILLFGCFLKP